MMIHVFSLEMCMEILCIQHTCVDTFIAKASQRLSEVWGVVADVEASNPSGSW